MSRFFCFNFCFLFAYLNHAQYITHGPVLGGLTDSSLNIYLRTNTSQEFTIEIDQDSLFLNAVLMVDSTLSSRDNSTIIHIHGLNSNTIYFYRFRFGNDVDQRLGHFKTAPSIGESGNFSFVTGSCQETDNMKVYDVMPTYNPLFMLHMGDFTYPSYQLNNDYPSQWSSIELSYQKRYEEMVMKDKLLPFIPLAYMPDDDDNFGPNRSHHYSVVSTGSFPNLINTFSLDTISQVERDNCLKGYRSFFPGYPTVDTTEGHYHSFKIANAEFFILDTRSMADSPHEAYSYDVDSNLWTFEPDMNHSILGENQMNWLLNGLSNSTAKWKFIATGVPFNPSMRRIIDAGVMAQGYLFDIAGESGSGMRLSASLAGYWAGYPSDIEKLVNHVANNQIEGLIVISGDAHNNVMDDGTNSVFPELCASGLSVSSNELAYQMNEYAPLFGQPAVTDSLWNAGGNGLFNENFKNAFGRVEVFGEDSVTCCVIDEDNETLACMTIFADGTVSSYNSINEIEKNISTQLKLFPNPVLDKLYIDIEPWKDQSKYIVEVIDLYGKQIIETPFVKTSVSSIGINLDTYFQNGIYKITLKDSNNQFLGNGKFVILK